MEGQFDDAEHRGIIPRSVHLIFQQLEDKKVNTMFLFIYLFIYFFVVSMVNPITLCIYYMRHKKTGGLLCESELFGDLQRGTWRPT
jgi:hypothetical protein